MISERGQWTAYCVASREGCSRGPAPGEGGRGRRGSRGGVERRGQGEAHGIWDLDTLGVAQLLPCHYFHSPNSIEYRELFLHAVSDPKQSPMIFCSLNM